MGSLGSLGRAHDPAEVTFDWFGTEIRCHPEISGTSVVDEMEFLAQVDEDSPQAMSFVKKFLQGIIHPDDFETYWSLAKTNRQDTEDHMTVAKAVLEAVAKRPTQQSSDSSTGLTPSAAESMASLLEQAMPGRPDLQAGVGQELIAKQQLRAV
jgi:hypothetical protein